MTESKISSQLGELLKLVRAQVENPRAGLPNELFFFVSQLTPMVNVDLLVKNQQGQTLLTWRKDEFYGPGWHVPGGIIRFKENIDTRVRKVAVAELGANVRFSQQPLHIREVMATNRDVRGHFISILYLCELTSPPAPDLQCHGDTPQHGQWRWHDKCPPDLISQHESYRQHIDQTLHCRSLTSSASSSR